MAEAVDRTVAEEPQRPDREGGNGPKEEMKQ
jgi:hypothetical protein